MFSDSISNNVSILEELVRTLPAHQRNSAKKSCAKICNAFDSLRKDYPKNPAVVLGTAFAIFKIAEQLVEAGKNSSVQNDSLIQLLS